MHEAGLWGRSLYPSLAGELVAAGDPAPSEGLVVETLRVAGLLHDVGHGPFAHFFDDHVLSRFSAPPDARRAPGKPLSHEDLSQVIIERELGAVIGGLRRAPGTVAARDAFADGEAIDPRWVSFLVSKPALADDGMPRWVRWLQPLLSGVFTVDNLDYVRRDAWMTGVADGRRRRAAAALRVHRAARADALRAGPRDARAVPDRAAVHVPAGLLPPDGPGDRPGPGRGIRAVDRGDVRRPRRRSSGCRRTPTSTSTRCFTRPRGGRAGSRWPTRRPMATDG